MKTNQQSSNRLHHLPYFLFLLRDCQCNRTTVDRIRMFLKLVNITVCGSRVNNSRMNLPAPTTEKRSQRWRISEWIHWNIAHLFPSMEALSICQTLSCSDCCLSTRKRDHAIAGMTEKSMFQALCNRSFPAETSFFRARTTRPGPCFRI